jgi:hypothetical protein
LFFLWWNTLIYCNWQGRFVSGNCHNLCHWTVSSEDSCTKIVGKWTESEKIFLGICRRIVKCPNIVQLEILRPTFKNFTLSATGFGKNTFIIPYYDIDSVKRKYFCFCQPSCYCFLGPKWGRPKTYIYTPVCFPNICWHSGLNNQCINASPQLQYKCICSITIKIYLINYKINTSAQLQDKYI